MAANTVLVVGGAGYIGSHTCLALAMHGFNPVVCDNLSNGHREFVQWGDFEEADIRDQQRLEAIFAKHRPVAVMHFAALIEVGESVKNPVAFYENNVIGALTLLAAAQQAGVEAFVFSSTCATYGLPDFLPIDETHRQAPINPYGKTKWVIEQALSDFGKFTALRSVILRYFNAAGADSAGRIGEWHNPETHAIPVAIEVALGQRDSFQVFGTDYETRDGTCVRDYIHVSDLAEAHVKALQYLLDGGASMALNLGTGTGTTVSELLSTIQNVSGRRFPVRYAHRRPGDTHTLVANNDRARSVLKWAPKHDLHSMVESAWAWHSRF